MYKSKLFLYSVNTWLAYKISELYYNNIHYVWCSPHFNASNINPPSSNPKEIYWNLKKDIDGKDHHSSKIEQNKVGIIKGANIKKSQGIITDIQEQEIIDIVSVAEMEDFRPLIYIIPTEKVKGIINPVSYKFKADKFSQEYIIEELASDFFDIVDLDGRL